MNIKLNELHGIGLKRARALSKLGIETPGDLLLYFPRRYEDRRETRRIADFIPGESVCVIAAVTSQPEVNHVRKGLDLLKFRAADETGVLEISFFNQIWRKADLKPGEIFVFYGKPELFRGGWVMNNPDMERENVRELTGRITPFYSLTAGVSQMILRRSVREALNYYNNIDNKNNNKNIIDIIPEEIRRDYGLCDINYAYHHIHFPEDEKALLSARRRLAFEELFLFSIGLRGFRNQREMTAAPKLENQDFSKFLNILPFDLTNAQKRCIQEAAADMASGVPMNRLCQGDVGSGKTMIAAGCIYLITREKRQAAMMAPTEILARQHFESLAPIMRSLGISCDLLTGATTAKARRELNNKLKTGELNFLIGTHALISGNLEWRDLGLVITDEQHRFGVTQRASLADSGSELCPHTLVMSATPIPRTLALALYGDLDISVLDESPPGRKKIETYAVTGAYRERIYKFIKKLISQGRQAYIICPMVSGEAGELSNGDMIGAEEKNACKAVEEYAENLRKNIFPDLQIGHIHGRMKAKEKDAIMSAFAAGDINILVATTVIEVGVDVPNAVIIVIENAERFGLSQLHQLRGRVGRGQEQSYCILISDAQNEDTKKRLKAMTRTADGFQIAEEDLKIRGPGDFFGRRQHGLPNLKVADLGMDTDLLKQAQEAAEKLSRDDPGLKQHELIIKRVAAMFADSQAETSLN